MLLLFLQLLWEDLQDCGICMLGDTTVYGAPAWNTCSRSDGGQLEGPAVPVQRLLSLFLQPPLNSQLLPDSAHLHSKHMNRTCSQLASCKPSCVCGKPALSDCLHDEERFRSKTCFPSSV